MAEGKQQHAKSIHVITSEVVDVPGVPMTAGGQRSIQIISALRRAGHEVTFSMPLTTALARTHRDAILNHLGPKERWFSEHTFEPEIVLNRIEPEAVIFCNINMFKSVRRYSKDTVQIVDLCGPVHLEDAFMHVQRPGEAAPETTELQSASERLVSRLSEVDYLMTVSERQKYFWAAYCSLAGFGYDRLVPLVCPFSIESSANERRLTPRLSVVSAGWFYPWQDPYNSLAYVAEALERIEGAEFHIIGGGHEGLRGETEARLFLDKLRKKYRCVRHRASATPEELRVLLSTAWCAVDLMERHLERELAISGRTLEYLAAHVPVIHNDYSSFSELIRKYDAGWCINPSSPSAMECIFTMLVKGGPGLVTELSNNAGQLHQAEFNPEKCMAPLLQLCAGPLMKRAKGVSASGVNHAPFVSKKTTLGNVLAISLSTTGAVPELRVNNPLRSLHRQHIIDRFLWTDPALDRLRSDPTPYNMVFTQRALPSYIYEALESLGLPFLLDVDDNLLAPAAYRRGAIESSLMVGLRHATVLTTPNPRLVGLLEKYSGCCLASRAFMAPNALPYPESIREPSAPAQLLWIQSDIAALTGSREPVVRAVEDFSRRHDLPVVLIGRNVLEKIPFRNAIEMGEIDLTSNLQLLEFAPTSIGVAPLETACDEATRDFIGGKSDLKMLLFGGYGHAGVYSNAAPYTDSGIIAGRMTDNSYAAWTEALEHEFRQGWREAAGNGRRIRERRHIDVVARSCWRPALEAVRFNRPQRGADLYDCFMTFRNHRGAQVMAARQMLKEAGVRKWVLRPALRVIGRQAEVAPESPELLLRAIRAQTSHLLQLAGVPDPDSERLRAQINACERQLREVHESYSWKITAPLRVIAAPVMRRLAKRG